MAGTLKIEDFDDPEFDPFSVSEVVARQGVVTDIYSELRRLRLQNSIWEIDPRLHFGSEEDGTLVGYKKWTVLAHKDVNSILTDQNLFSNKNYERNLGLMFGRSITAMDPPEHQKYRALFQKAFAPNMLGDWRERLIPRMINDLISQFVDRGRAELITEFALQFPFRFITDVLELPPEFRKTFHRLAFSQTCVRYDREHALEGGRKLGAYLQALVDERRDNPVSENDFVHVLATAEVNDERLPEIVLNSFLRQLMNAAGDTSYHGFSNLLSGLLRHPDQLEAVRKDRSLLPAVIEEGLRWEAPIVYLERTPFKEVTIEGRTMQPGDHVFVAIGAANRDESVYENPDEFNIFRKNTRMLSFGRGPHVCIGQHLARAEMTVALNALLDLPNLRLDATQPEPVVCGVTMRKPKAVHVLFG